MERFVLTISYGNGCSWSATETIPIEYVNKESLWVELNSAIKEAYANKVFGWFKFSNREICVDWFMEVDEKGRYFLPEYPVEEHEIETVDEWFWNYS